MIKYLNENYRTDLMDEAEELYGDNVEAFERAFKTIMNVDINSVDDWINQRREIFFDRFVKKPFSS